MILGGYFLGRTIPNIGEKIHYVILVVVLVSILPIIIGFLMHDALRQRPTAAMAEVPIRTIVFDIGRVLIRIDVAKPKAGLAKGLPLSPDQLWSAIEHDPRWQDWQEGRMAATTGIPTVVCDWVSRLTSLISPRFGMTLWIRHPSTPIRVLRDLEALQARAALQYRSDSCSQARIELRIFPLFPFRDQNLFLRGGLQQSRVP